MLENLNCREDYVASLLRIQISSLADRQDYILENLKQVEKQIRDLRKFYFEN